MLTNHLTSAISTHSKLCRTAFPLRSKSAAVAGVRQRSLYRSRIDIINSKTFHYRGNNQNLFYGLIFISLLFWFLYAFGLPSINPPIVHQIVSIFYAAFLLFIIWVAHYYIKTYFKLRGHRRSIIIGSNSIVFPEYGDSLKIIEVSFSHITEIYFSEGRHGIPDNLIIKYGDNSHAYIGKDNLKPQDFHAICELIRIALNLKSISIKNA